MRPTLSGVKAVVAALTQSKADSAKALQGRVTADAGRDAVSAQQAGWKAKADAALRDSEGALQRMASAGGLPDVWVDAFFLPPVPAKAKDAPAGPAVPA